MSRPAIFKGKLRQPQLLQDLAQLMSNVSKGIHLVVDQTSVAISTVQREFELWVQVNNETLFLSTEHSDVLAAELSAESLARVLQSSDTSATDVHIIVERKTEEMLSVLIKMDALTVGTLSIRQKIYASPVDESSLRVEPQLDQGAMFCKLRRFQLSHLAKVSDRYKTMSSRLQVELRKKNPTDVSAEITLTVNQPGLLSSTSFDVSSVTLDSSQGELSQPDTDSAKVIIRSKDWHSMLQVRRIVDEVVIGISDDQVVAVYANIAEDENNTLTFYLFQTIGGLA